MNSLKRLFCGILIALLLVSCSDDEEIVRDYSPSDYPDILSIRGNPEKEDRLNTSLFFDMGSWTGYALREEAVTGFAGPYSLRTRKWVLKASSQVSCRIDGKEADFTQVGKTFYPGHLSQEFNAEAITLSQEMIFATANHAAIQTTLTNNSSEDVVLNLILSGEAFASGIVKKDKSQVLICDGENSLAIRYSEEPSGLKVFEKRYAAEFSQVEIPGGESKSFTTVYKYDFPEVKEESNSSPEDFEELKEENIERWTGYLNDALAVDTYTNKDSALKRIGVKSVVTLINNWRKKAGDLKHDGLFPSYAYEGFHGFWAWDSWKHAVALAGFHPDLAREQILAMFDFQQKNGMIPDCIYPDKEQNNLRNSKPPLAGWAVYKYYDYTSDGDFLKDIYPKLKKYHNWWYTHRDHDGDSLCEFGSTDGTLTAAKWESGMDNAVRFDEAKLLKNSENAWSLNQESVDLNSYLYLEKLYLANMAWVLSKKEEAVNYENEAKALKEKIEEKFYHEKDNYFYDIHFKTDSAIRIKGAEAWIALYAKIGGYKMRRKVGQQMYKESQFNTFVPFPTVSVSHPEFEPRNGYWRGSVWLDQAYFAVQGMRKANLWDESNEMFKKLLNNPAGLKGQAPIYENYHPESGVGLNAPHFSWSAAHLIMLFRDEK